MTYFIAGHKIDEDSSLQDLQKAVVSLNQIEEQTIANFTSDENPDDPEAVEKLRACLEKIKSDRAIIWALLQSRDNREKDTVHQEAIKLVVNITLITITIIFLVLFLVSIYS